MEWTQDKTLEFIGLLKTKPCLWEPRFHTPRNRAQRNDAWQNIKKSLSFDTTVEELKHKKESMQGYYRSLIKKFRANEKKNEPYVTDWFAFDAMDSFLRPIYTEKRVQLGSRLWTNSDDNSNTSPCPVIYMESTGLTPAVTKQTGEPLETRSRLADTDTDTSNDKTDLRTDDKALLDDEFQIYGSYVASQIKLLSEEQSVIARDQIQSVLTQSRLLDLGGTKNKNVPLILNKTKTVPSEAGADIHSVYYDYILNTEEIKSETSDE